MGEQHGKNVVISNQRLHSELYAATLFNTVDGVFFSR